MNSPFPCRHQKRFVNRRDFLWELGGGLGGVAFAAMNQEAQAATNPLAPKASASSRQSQSGDPNLLSGWSFPRRYLGLQARVGEASGQAVRC